MLLNKRIFSHYNNCVCFKLYFSYVELMNVYQADDTFPFDKMALEMPMAMPNNSYFTSLTIDGKPIYIETPQINTKQGIVKGAKKTTCDLLFSTSETGFINWTETLESTCHGLVYLNSGDWFQEKLEYDDIENAFAPSMKSYKSGKFQVCRCNVPTNHHTGNPITKIYDEGETLIPCSDINEQSQLICIVEVKGIRFTTRSFQIDYELRQAMVMAVDTVFDKCLIKKGSRQQEPSQKIGIPIPKFIPQPHNKEDTTENDNEEEAEKHEEDDKDKIDSTEVTDTLTPILVDQETINEVVKSPTLLTEHIFDDIEKETSATNEDVPNLEIIDKQENEPLNQEKTNTNELIATPEEIVINKKNNEDLEILDMDTAFDITSNDENTIMEIKKPNQVYHEIYKKAKERAKELKRQAIEAILEANSLKNTYMLDGIDDSDEEDMQSLSSDSDEEHQQVD